MKKQTNVWNSVKIRNFLFLKIKENVGPDKETLNMNQFFDEAVKEKLQRMGVLQ